MVAATLAIAVCIAACCGEAAHRSRVRRLCYLAFGSGGAPRQWTRIAPAVRVLGLTSFVYGCCALWEWSDAESEATAGNGTRLLLALDVSPSMQLVDSGADGKLSRERRANDVLRHLMNEVDDGCRITIGAFYGRWLPVVVDTADRHVVANVLAGLPLGHAFAERTLGTNVVAGLEGACGMAKAWRAASTVLVLVTDGDAEEAGRIPVLPPSIRQTFLLGVGSRHGRLIEAASGERHESAQKPGYLRSMAGRLGNAAYFDCNEYLPRADLFGLSSALSPPGRTRSDRDISLAAVVAGSVALVVLELLLRCHGKSRAPAATLLGEGRSCGSYS